MTFIYKPKGVCSQQIKLEIENNKLQSAEFFGGCNGNLKGIAALCKDMELNEIINRLEGIKCGFKATSCPDQLAQALKAYIQTEE